MFTDYDPDYNEPNCYDDRDQTTPEFEIDEELAFGLGMDERDPADDGEPLGMAVVGSGINQ